MSTMIRDAIGKLIRHQDLEPEEATTVMREIMGGEASAAQIAGFLTALAMKGETDSEIAAMAMVMREHVVRVHIDRPLVDTCGTGGDGSQTFNISTTAAFVVAGAGVSVAKHGNRAMSSACGSADVLEALGVNLELSAEGVIHCIEQAGIGFLFAPSFHPAMRFASPVRREIGIRTVFNLLGPVTNPAGATYQVVGVPTPTLAQKVARAMSKLNMTRALVITGDGGMDELSLSGPNLIFDVIGDREPERLVIDAEELGFARASREALRGGDRTNNARILRSVLEGTEQGACSDVVVLNAAAALMTTGRASDLVTALPLARRSLESGAALRALDTLIQTSQTVT